MKKMKKVFALMLTFALIASMATFSMGTMIASAEGEEATAVKFENNAITFKPGSTTTTDDAYLHQTQNSPRGNVSFGTDGALNVGATGGGFVWAVNAPATGIYKLYFTTDKAIRLIVSTNAGTIFAGNQYTTPLSASAGDLVLAGRIFLQKGANQVNFDNKSNGNYSSAAAVFSEAKLELEEELATKADGSLKDRLVSYKDVYKPEGATNAYQNYLDWLKAKMEAKSLDWTRDNVRITEGGPKITQYNKQYSSVSGYTHNEWVTENSINLSDMTTWSAYMGDTGINNAIPNAVDYVDYNNDGTYGDVNMGGFYGQEAFAYYSVIFEETGYYDMYAMCTIGRPVAITFVGEHIPQYEGVAFTSRTTSAVTTKDDGIVTSGNSFMKESLVKDKLFFLSGRKYIFKAQTDQSKSDTFYRYFRFTKDTSVPTIGTEPVEILAKDQVGNWGASYTLAGTDNDVVLWPAGSASTPTPAKLNVAVNETGNYKIYVKAMQLQRNPISGFISTGATMASSSTNSLLSNIAAGKLHAFGCKPGTATRYTVADIGAENVSTLKTKDYIDYGTISLSQGAQTLNVNFGHTGGSQTGIYLYSIKIEKVETRNEHTYVIDTNKYSSKNDGTASAGAGLQTEGRCITVANAKAYAIYTFTIPTGGAGKYKVTAQTSAFTPGDNTPTIGFERAGLSSLNGSSTAVAETAFSKGVAYHRYDVFEADGYIKLDEGENSIKVYKHGEGNGVLYSLIKLEKMGEYVAPSVTLTQNEEAVTDFAVGSVTATANFNGIGLAKGAVLYAPVYDANGKTLGCTTAEVASTSEPLSLTFTVPEAAAGYSVYLFEGETYRPVVAPISYGEAPATSDATPVGATNTWVATTVTHENVGGKIKLSGTATPNAQVVLLVKDLSSGAAKYAKVVEATAEGTYEDVTTVPYNNFTVYASSETSEGRVEDLYASHLVLRGATLVKDTEGAEEGYYKAAVAVPLYNYTDAAKNAVVIVAAYNGSTLSAVESVSTGDIAAFGTTKADTVETATVEYTTTAQFDETKDYTFKVFVWNTISDLAPVTQVSGFSFDAVEIE